MLTHLETFALAEAQRITHLKDEALLTHLESIVKMLSDSFTTMRPDSFSAYLDQPEVQAAYTLFFAPQTFIRTQEALRGIYLRQTPVPPQHPIRILDLGSGSGAASLGAIDTLSLIFPEATFHLTAVDHSQSTLNTLHDFITKTLPSCTIETVCMDARAYHTTDTYDLILVSFSLNEFYPAPDTVDSLAWLHRFLPALKATINGYPAQLLILEPAGKVTSPRLNALRMLLQPTHRLFAPCPHAKICPLNQSEDGFCHDVRHFKPSRLMHLLNRHLYRSISDVKYSILALGRPEAPLLIGQNDETFFRQIGPVNKIKGRLALRICQGDGAKRTLEIAASALGGVRRHQIRTHQRGDNGFLTGSEHLIKTIQSDTIQRTSNVRYLDEPAPETHEEEDDPFHFSI